ncbi:hypothetical protein HD554DRAFT_2190998 [Boletus coccyginus]|nr:hypothetical protein HD554DRAFT_2190998 [Boletus coccyginus]
MRLGQKQPVALQFVDGCKFYALFKDNVEFHQLDNPVLLLRCPFVWALCDSNQSVTHPSSIFLGKRNIRVIQTTSPNPSRWKEWSKQAGAWPYVMDIFSNEEMTSTLMGKNVDRMIALAKKWGGVARTLLQYTDEADLEITRQYRQCAQMDVEECRLAGLFDTPSDSSSQFCFVRPLVVSQKIVRNHSYFYVPTRTLRSLLGEALQGQSDDVKLEFFNALSRPEETRQAASFIFESWFHSFLSAAGTLQREWTGSRPRSTTLQGVTKLIPATQIALESEEPPYYWVSPKNFPGVDSALVFKKEIIAFQVTPR